METTLAESKSDGEIRNSATHSENPSISTNIINLAKAAEEKHVKAIQNIEKTIDEKLMKDVSPEAKRGRRMMMYRAAYGEFMCTFLFLTPIFGCLVNAGLNDSSNPSFIAAFVGGFQAIAVSFAFSSVSGAHFNPAISWALWLTGKLSNRKCIVYIVVQFLASIIGMSVIASMFREHDHYIYEPCVVSPTDNSSTGEVFATEFFLTFILTYVAFTVVFEDAESSKKETMSFQALSDSQGLTLYASTPQSKTGFAPFAIGFTIFSLSLISGESGGAFNPARMLGPAIFSGKWDLLYLYWFAQFLGSSCAALLVQLSFRVGLQTRRQVDTLSALEAMNQVSPAVASFDAASKGGNQGRGGGIVVSPLAGL